MTPQALAVLTTLGALLAATAQPARGQDSAVRLDEFRSCGLTSFYTVCRLHKINLSWQEAQRVLGPPDQAGYHTFADLATAGQKVGLVSRGFRLTREEALALPTPAVVQSKFAYGKEELHLLVMLQATEEGVQLLDPPFQPFFMPWDEFEQVWTGNVLVVQPADRAEAIDAYAAALGPKAEYRLAFAAVLVAGLALLAVVGRLILQATKRSARWAWQQAARHPIAAGLGTLIFAGGCWLLLWFGRAETPATFQPPGPVVNLGVFMPGSRKTEFTVRNPGSQDLAIEDVVSTCACAGVEAPPTIRARAEATVTVALNVRPGMGSALLRFETNDPAGPKVVRLVWHGKGRPVLSPAVIAPTAVAPGRELRYTVRVFFPGEREAAPPSFLGASFHSPLLRVRHVETVPATLASDVGAGWEPQGYLALEVTITGPDGTAALEEDVLIRVRYAGESLDLPLRVYLRAARDLTPVPAGVLFSATRPQGLVGQSRRLRIRTDRDPVTLRLEKGPPWLHHTFSRLQTGEIALELSCIAVPEQIGEPIEARVTVAGEPELFGGVRIDTFVTPREP